MKRFKQFATQHPYLFMLIIFPLTPYLLLLLQVGASSLFGFDSYGIESFQDSTKVISVLLYLLVLWRFDWLRLAGFVFPGRWQAWVIMAGGSVLELVLVIRTVNGHFEWSNLTVMADPPAYLLVGLFEEIAFRGLILYAFLQHWGNTPRGVLKSVLISSLLFGLGHLTTLWTGNTIQGAIYQGASCTFSGIWCAALVLYGRSIWPAVTGHFLVDAIGLGNLTYVSDLTRANLLIFWIEVPLLLTGLYLLTRLSRKRINRHPVIFLESESAFQE